MISYKVMRQDVTLNLCDGHFAGVFSLVMVCLFFFLHAYRSAIIGNPEIELIGNIGDFPAVCGFEDSSDFSIHE